MGVYRGIEGVRAVLARVARRLGDRPVRAIELVDAGDRVVALIDQRMRGRSTGIELPFGKYAHVYTFRDGLDRPLEGAT